MDITRREFVQGAFASLGIGMMGGWRLFAAPPGWKRVGTANLVFGVISDTHLISSRRKREELMWTRTRHPFGNEKGRADKYLVSALEYFRERNVDAVMHCGDMADQGLVSEMEWTAAAWHRVFPGNRAPDGHEIVKLFVTGNHDVEGMWRVARAYPDAAERARRMLNTDMAGHWERIWGEPFEDVWHKEVKGYHFFGRNFGEENKAKFVQLLAAANARFRLGEGTRPFFIASHTGYAGRDNKEYRKSLKANLANAVAFFGHHHWSLANWNRVYFDIRSDVPEIQCPPCNCSFGASLKDSDSYIVPVRIEETAQVGMARQGLVVSVFDDCVLFERRDFNIPGGSLGADWVMPLGKCDPHPFSKDELKKVIGEPQFRKNAKLMVSSASAQLRVRIPLADGNPDSRVYAYDVEMAGDEGTTKLRKAVYAAGVNMGIGHEPNGGVTTLEIPKSELPEGKTLTVAVRPLSSLGTVGCPITAKFRI